MREGIEDAGGNMSPADTESEAYNKYIKLGGIINRADYEKALGKEVKLDHEGETFILQAKIMAKFAGIELAANGTLDRRVELFIGLRGDRKPQNIQDHHAQMNDAQLFAEALKIADDEDALIKLKKAYHRPGIYCPICLQVAKDENCT